MNPKIYNSIANLSLIVAVASTFVWDKMPLLALLMGVGAALTATVIYFYNRAWSADWARSEVEQAEPGRGALPAVQEKTVPAPLQDEALSGAVKEAVDAIQDFRTWEIHHVEWAYSSSWDPIIDRIRLIETKGVEEQSKKYLTWWSAQGVLFQAKDLVKFHLDAALTKWEEEVQRPREEFPLFEWRRKDWAQ